MKTQIHFEILIYALSLLLSEGSFAQASLLKDINPGTESSINNTTFTKIGDKLLFKADDGINGYEGWITDGTPTGTIRMEENTENLIDTIYTVGGNGLFKTNETKLTYVFANLGFKLVNRVTKVNETWFFVANIDTYNREELWKSDGTEAGTVLVKKFRPNSLDYAYTANLIATPDNTALLFTADDGPGIALWKSDGTTDGTIKIKSFSTSKQYQIGSFINYNNQTFFWAKSPDGYQSLWKTDGTTAGTVMVYDKLACTLNPGHIVVYKNKIYFRGQRQGAPYDNAALNYNLEELWVSDGTAAGTNLFFVTNPAGPYGGYPDYFHLVNNLIIFTARTELNGKELWVTDGSANGTFMLKDVYPGTESGILNYWAIKELNKVFFTGFDGNQRMLWETDGTVAGTIPLYDISESDLPIYSRAGYVNNKLIFVKETIDFGQELWSTNATLSTDEFNNSSKVTIYPNPVTTNLTVHIPSTGDSQLKVFNQLGQLVLTQQQKAASTSLNVSNLTKGLYFLNITSENGKTQTIKFIKN